MSKTYTLISYCDTLQEPDPVQTRKISNWRGEMQIRELEVPVFSAYQNTPSRSPQEAYKEGYAPNNRYGGTWKAGQSGEQRSDYGYSAAWKDEPENSKYNNAARPNSYEHKPREHGFEGSWKDRPKSKEQDRYASNNRHGTWKEGPKHPEQWQDSRYQAADYGGMAIHIADNEEELLRNSPKEISKSYGAYPELRRIQIWPSAMPTVPSMRSPTPTNPLPSKAPEITRPVNGNHDAKRVQNVDNKNMDIVHAPSKEGEQERKYGEHPAQDPVPTSFHFTEPVSRPSQGGQFHPHWPEHIRDSWLADTGGISIAIASKI